MAEERKMAASKLLAGGAALRRLEERSPEERKQADYLLWLSSRREYQAWLAGLPLSKDDRELVAIVDRVRQRLLSGMGAHHRVTKALRVFGNWEQRQGKKVVVCSWVDAAHKTLRLPLIEDPKDAQGAFEFAGAQVEPRLSASQVKKIYYEKKKLPRK